MKPTITLSGMTLEGKSGKKHLLKIIDAAGKIGATVELGDGIEMRDIILDWNETVLPWQAHRKRFYRDLEEIFKAHSIKINR